MNSILWLSHPTVRSYVLRKIHRRKPRFDSEQVPLISTYEEQVDTLLRYEMMKNILNGIVEAADQVKKIHRNFWLNTVRQKKIIMEICWE